VLFWVVISPKPFINIINIWQGKAKIQIHFQKILPFQGMGKVYLTFTISSTLSPPKEIKAERQSKENYKD